MCANYAEGLTQEEIDLYPNVCSIITRAVGDGGQSSDRGGATVQNFQIHHSTMLTADSYIQMVQSNSRTVSSTFAVQDDQIIRIVNLTRRPFTSASPYYDSRAFTVETANSTLAPDYKVSEKSKNSLGLIAEAMLADGALPALSNEYIYLHKDMVPRFDASYSTSCPMDITVDDIISRAKNQSVQAQISKEPAMTVLRIVDWANRCYLVNAMGHTYIPDPAEVAGLLKAAQQDAPLDVLFGHFLPAVARINYNLEQSSLAKLIKSASPTQSRAASATIGASTDRPDWVDQDLWAEASSRGEQNALTV